MQFFSKLTFLSLLLFSSVALAQTTGYISHCFGSGCAQPGSYNGPMVDYRVQGGDSKSLNQHAYEAYRYGKVQEFQNFRSHVTQQIIEFEKSKVQGELSDSQLAELTSKVKQKLSEEYPIPDPGVLGADVREKLNPVPRGYSRKDLNSKLDSIWHHVQKSDPVGLAQSLNELAQKRVRFGDSVPPEVSDIEGEFLEKELRYSGVLNGQGLIKAPFASTPNDSLLTSPTTWEGAEVRAGLNKLLAAESVVGAKCALSPELTSQCENVQSMLNETVAAFYALDRTIDIQGGITTAETLALYHQLQAVAEFSSGITKGMWNGVISTAEGLVQLASHPIESVRAIADAMYNAGKTFEAFKEIIESKYDQLLNGSASERGEVIGQAAFEIASLFVPVGQLSKMAKTSSLLKAAGFEALASGIGNSARVSKILTKAEVRAQLIARHMNIKASEISDFLNWSAKNLDLESSGDFAVAFARKVTPKRLRLLQEAGAELGETVSESAHSYIAMQLTYEKALPPAGRIFTRNELVEMAQDYDRMARAMEKIPGKSAPSEGYRVKRGVAKEYDFYGTKRTNTKEDVFKVSRYNEFSHHRYSQPHEAALYTTMGEGAENVIAAEAGKARSELIFSERTYRPKKVLDLSDESVLRELDLSLEDILEQPSIEKNFYYKTQMIGNIARKNGFDAIIAPSSRNPFFKNLVILE